jgi:hypothetical protein
LFQPGRPSGVDEFTVAALNKSLPSFVFPNMDPKELPLPADEAKKLAEQAEQPERQGEARQAEEETEVNPADSNLERNE